MRPLTLVSQVLIVTVGFALVWLVVQILDVL